MMLPPELRANYILRRKKDLEILKEAIEKSNFSAVQKIGHQLKGNGITYGFANISELGQEMEAVALANDLPGVIRSVHCLEDWLKSIS